MLGTEEDPLWTVAVGWTSSRPIKIDEHVTILTAHAQDEAAMLILADSWVASRPQPWWRGSWEMTTSITILEVEL